MINSVHPKGIIGVLETLLSRTKKPPLSMAKDDYRPCWEKQTRTTRRIYRRPKHAYSSRPKKIQGSPTNHSVGKLDFVRGNFQKPDTARRTQNAPKTEKFAISPPWGCHMISFIP